jgi:hypothetical protein
MDDTINEDRRVHSTRMDDTINEDRRVHSTRMDDTINEDRRVGVGQSNNRTWNNEEHSDE